MNAKSLISILMAAVALSLASCNGNGKSEANDSTAANYTCEEHVQAYDPADYYADNTADINYDESYVNAVYETSGRVPQDITCHDQYGNVIYVHCDEYGNISGHDLNGNFISGYSDDYGYTSIHDMNGNYVNSYSDGYGNTTSYDMNGNITTSYTDSYGNTSGHDLDGNYYSAYSTDCGSYTYTTITTY